MEDDEAGDDQGTGWLEVKKKSRTSLKLLGKKGIGGSSNKSHSLLQQYQVTNNDSVGTSHGKQQFEPIQAGANKAAHTDIVADISAASVKADHDADCIDKVVVNQEGEPRMFVAVANAVEQVPLNADLNDAPNVKWGDLEDIDRSNVEYGFRNGDLKCQKNPIDCGDSVIPLSSTPHQEGKTVVASQVAGHCAGKKLSTVLLEESLQGILKGDDEIPPGNLELMNACSGNSPKNAVAAQSEAASHLASRSSSLHVEVIEEITLEGPHHKCDPETLGAADVSTIAENMSMGVALKDIVLLQDENISASAIDDCSDKSVMEGQRSLQDTSVDVVYHREDESVGSKERFRQRLWCFLFENLNRAIDELYLLCELECDVEQMNEALLVLREAACDFRELKSRVENFDSTKNSSAHSKEGTPMNVKTDHRRPHALSWEVRRMTSSPHRAEILSSSLEAFKKIQLERAGKHADIGDLTIRSTFQHVATDSPRILPGEDDVLLSVSEPGTKPESQLGVLDANQVKTAMKNQNVETTRASKACFAQSGCLSPQGTSNSASAECKREPLDPISEIEKQVPKKDKVSNESRLEKHSKATDMIRKSNTLVEKEKEKEKEKRNTASWKSMDAWKEKRNWEEILKSPMRNASRASHSLGMSRKGQERGRVLHDKLMSPEKKKKSTLDMKREAEEKHARAMRIRGQLETERVQRLQRTSEKFNRVNEWQAVRSMKLREGMYARHQRNESRHEAYLAQVARRAGDESSKVNEVRFITSLNDENKKLILRQKLHDSEMRRAEKLQFIRTKQKEDTAREEAVLERRKLLEAEKLQRLAETQRRKEEAQVRREEERKASSAAREAKAVEQLRRKEIRAKAQQEEAELLAQRLAERLRESEQRRKYYLEQIREKASMDFRDQSSPLLRRSLNKEGQSRPIPNNSIEDCQAGSNGGVGDSASKLMSTTQFPLKKRIKKIRQKLMALKHEFTEPSVVGETTGISYRAVVGVARAKIGRWLQDLQKLRQSRKEGATSIGLIVGDMIKFLDGKDPELNASRQGGLLDFISSALPASHTSKPEACQVTLYFLRLLRVILSLSANRSYFLAQNLLPPIIPMLSASLENYIKIAASSNPGSNSSLPSKTSTENMDSITETVDGFLWIVTTIVGHVPVGERELQMQGGLVELIVAYQVIHRLRDLIALYDRPQVEGSPFPSSIILSLNLLAVLTSRPGSISSIDWESCMSKAAPQYAAQECRLSNSLESLESGVSYIVNKPLTNHIVTTVLPTNECCQATRQEKLLSMRLSDSEGRPVDSVRGTENSDILNDMNKEQSPNCARSTSCESTNIVLEESTKSLLLQKDVCSRLGGTEKKGVEECSLQEDNEEKKDSSLKQPIAFLLSAVAETGLVSLPSLLTAVLLQANNRMSAEQGSYTLPLNFEEVATGVLRVLNNLALLDITLLQNMLARSDLKMEIFHLMSFLLSHCTNKWKVANDQVGLLLLESLLLLGYFALFHAENQAVLRWGKSPTILHKICDLPFVFFSDPELMPILAGTLVAACYGCEQNRGVVQQELSIDMLLSLLKSCQQGILSLQSETSPPDSSLGNELCDSINHSVPEVKKPQSDFHMRPTRRSIRILSGKVFSGSNMRISKSKFQRDNCRSKTCDDWALKHNLRASEAASTFMLHCRFPSTFLDKAEEFFSAGISSQPE